jgi:hypothetical protein
LTDSFEVHSADGTTHTVTVTINGTNDGPTVTAADTAHASDLVATREDTPHTYTQADLLRLVGATDMDGDMLSVSAVTVDAQYGVFSKQANGDWLFTPAANVHHDDIPLTLTVSDGHATATAHALLDIAPVTDAATPTLSVLAEQHVIQFGDTGAPAIYTAGGIQSGGDLHDFALEMSVVGGSQVAVQGQNGPTLVSYATSGDLNAMYIWRPENLQLHIGGQNYDTGVDVSHDTGSHRYGFFWNGAAGTFDVLRDGQILKHLDNLPKGASLAGGGVMAFGNDQDSLGGGFQDGDAWHGQLFSATMAKGVSAADMTQHTLRDLAQGAELIMDVQAQGQSVVDLTGHHTFATSGPVTTPTTQVDTAIANPNPGALLHLTVQFGPPQDLDDVVTSAVLKGFAAGTEVSDGHGHTQTVSGPDDRVDITHWNQAGLTAQLLLGSHAGAQLVLEVTTTGPGGSSATASSPPHPLTLNDELDLSITTDVTIQVDPAPPPDAVSGSENPDVMVAGGDALITGGDTGAGSADDGSAAAVQPAPPPPPVVSQDAPQPTQTDEPSVKPSTIEVTLDAEQSDQHGNSDYGHAQGQGNANGGAVSASDDSSQGHGRGHEEGIGFGNDQQHDEGLDSQVATVEVTSSVGGVSSPLGNYLQFADTTQVVGAGGAAITTASPLDDYLAAAGVDRAAVTMDAPDLPPTEFLVDVAHAADGGVVPDQTVVDDAALAAVPVEMQHQPQDDPQHHGA